MSQLVSVSDVSSGPWLTTQCEPHLLLCGNDHWGLPGKITARPQTSVLIQGQVMHRKSPRLRTVMAQFVHSQHLSDRLISESPASLDVSMRTNWLVHSYLQFRPQKDVRSSLGPVYICERPRQLQRHPPHAGALPDTTFIAPSTGAHRKDGGF
jgi:hypothetical protein